MYFMQQTTITKLHPNPPEQTTGRAKMPLHGWIGLALVAVSWPLNWLLPGLRTTVMFFPLWLGYCLTVDALVLRLRGTSLLTRSPRRYAGMFLVSAPVWWIYEALNLRIQNWVYQGAGYFGPVGYFLLASLCFSVVIPAIFGTAELVAGTRFVQNLKPWAILRGDRRTTALLFSLGWVMLGLMYAWPRIFFPFAWLSVLFLLEPVNVWLGNHSLTAWTARGDWRPVVSLFLGGLLTGFFWEMWNFYAYPKWIYQIPGVGFLHIFEMPILGYFGYLPFALELYALYHLIMGFIEHKGQSLLNIGEDV
jgi:hypothetical protein